MLCSCNPLCLFPAMFFRRYVFSLLCFFSAMFFPGYVFSPLCFWRYVFSQLCFVRYVLSQHPSLWPGVSEGLSWLAERYVKDMSKKKSKKKLQYFKIWRHLLLFVRVLCLWEQACQHGWYEIIVHFLRTNIAHKTKLREKKRRNNIAGKKHSGDKP